MRNNKINYFQKNTLVNLFNLYSIEEKYLKQNSINIKNLFDNKHYSIIEVGFGSGDNLINMAIQYPNINFVGIEIYKKGIIKILKKIHLYKLSNIKIIYQNAYEILSKIKKNSIYGIHILFPDPWKKIKHHKRRLLNLNFINIMEAVLIKDGFIHIATDIKSYGQLVNNNFSFNKNKFLKIKYLNHSIISRITKFQNRSKLENFYEILFHKIKII